MSFRSHLVRWEDEYAKCGLKIVEVSGGKYADFDFSRTLLKKWDIRHPVLWDKDNKNIRTFEIGGWPSAYLIGTDGTVFWQGNPGHLRSRVEDEQKFRATLEAELEKAKRVGK
jgi:hypothetical protein